jgi:hypothetical protein
MRRDASGLVDGLRWGRDSVVAQVQADTGIGDEAARDEFELRDALQRDER